jgi:hypothetical protein
MYMHTHGTYTHTRTYTRTYTHSYKHQPCRLLALGAPDASSASQLLHALSVLHHLRLVPSPRSSASLHPSPAPSPVHFHTPLPSPSAPHQLEAERSIGSPGSINPGGSSSSSSSSSMVGSPPTVAAQAARVPLHNAHTPSVHPVLLQLTALLVTKWLGQRPTHTRNSNSIGQPGGPSASAAPSQTLPMHVQGECVF